jgi:hypothetical protein
MIRISGYFIMCSLAALAACDTNVPTTSPAAAGISRTMGNPGNGDGNAPLTLAVIGDTPYGPAKLAELPDLIALINNDREIDVVTHLGDIKAGKNSPCTDEYFAKIRALFDTFEQPLVYTPGDNEWTDCHVATKNNGLFTPTERLDAVRALFFPEPGRTLGRHDKRVLTQSDDPRYADYVENVMWQESRAVFATLNITGSNDDLVSWGTPLPADAGNYPSQAAEHAARSAANTAWIAQAFATAEHNDARAVVLMFQADMWDSTSPLSGFDGLVTQIGTLAIRFGKPVLLLMGDSHVFNVDNPYAAASPLHSLHPSTPITDNVTRIVVEGSDAGRTEYLRLTIDPRAKAPSTFSWVRVPLH